MVAVLKNKSKTPAQDRLLKIVKNDPAAVNDLPKNPMVDFKPAAKNVLPKSYSSNASVVKSGDSLKSAGVAKFANDVQPAQVDGKIVHFAPLLEENKIKWSNDSAPNEKVSKIVSTTASDASKTSVIAPASFHLSGNGSQACQSRALYSDFIKKGHNAPAQNRFKINDNSKIIGGKWLSFDLI